MVTCYSPVRCSPPAVLYRALELAPAFPPSVTRPQGVGVACELDCWALLDGLSRRDLSLKRAVQRRELKRESSSKVQLFI